MSRAREMLWSMIKMTKTSKILNQSFLYTKISPKIWIKDIPLHLPLSSTKSHTKSLPIIWIKFMPNLL